MATTPVRPVKLLIAQLLLHLAAAVVVIALIIGLGSLVFGADLPGSPLPFAVAAILYSVAELSIGLLIAGLVSTAKAASVIGPAHLIALVAVTAACIALAAKYFRWQ